jgi:hypothetical protein
MSSIAVHDNERIPALPLIGPVTSDHARGWVPNGPAHRAVTHVTTTGRELEAHDGRLPGVHAANSDKPGNAGCE